MQSKKAKRESYSLDKNKTKLICILGSRHRSCVTVLFPVLQV